MNFYDVEYEFSNEDGSIVNGTAIVESEFEECNTNSLLYFLQIVRPDAKIVGVKLREQDIENNSEHGKEKL